MRNLINILLLCIMVSAFSVFVYDMFFVHDKYLEKSELYTINVLTLIEKEQQKLLKDEISMEEFEARITFYKEYLDKVDGVVLDRKAVFGAYFKDITKEVGELIK